ncbi:hypothetical protein A9Q99_05520 [Gammaproteobacteria bacterium 45_16_T64]|nr:hypothetical protein A9Q99_05520 [Gammaproteobacteria bacterium 45_16_T64]
MTAAQANSIEPTRLLEERKRFADARAQLRKGNLTQFSSISEELRDYPLYPYLDFFKHKRYISKLSLDQMDEFSRTNIDSPISYRLYNAWLASLARHQRWQDYVATYESSGKPKYDCYYYWALFKEGQTKRAFAGAEKLWLVGKSQQKACDPLFEVWKKTDAFNETIAWKRTQLAMNNRKLQLAKYLERFLAEPEKSISNEWRRVYRSPKRLQKISRYKQWSSKAKPLILSSFKRLILKETELARSLWPEYEKAFDFTPEESADVYQYFAKILALRYDDNAEYWLNQALTLPGGDVIIDYGIRHALRDHDWQRVKRWLAMTPQAERGSNQWRYWEAKANLAIEQYNTSQQQPLLFDTTAINLANEALSTFPIYDHLEEVTPYTQLLTPHISFMENLVNTNNTNALLPDSTLFLFDSQQLPKASFGELSSERSFYGFMSSEILDKPLQLNHQERVAEQEQLTRILSNPGIIRARELYQINEDSYAKSEWNLAISRMPSEDRSIAAQLADQWGWHHQAIMAAARSDIRDNLKLRFPIAFGSTVSSFANKNGIGDDWVLSLIRQESAFAFQAKSPVGALGMMQIMPATAKQVSKSIGLRYKGKRSLLSPKNNIQLGTAYMGQLLKRFQGNTILATAAYNAGPHRASRWQPKHLPMAGDIWIETIPFRETRNYVKNVMTYQAIYRAHLGQEIKLAKSLQSIPARSPRKVTTY